MAKKRKHAPEVFTINPAQLPNIPTPRGGANKGITSTYSKQKKVK